MRLTQLTAWALAAAMAGLSLGPAAAGQGTGVHCRPYTVEANCAGSGPCRLTMAYAPNQSPGADRYGYWYGIPGKQRHAHHHHRTVHVAAAHRFGCGGACWYRHPPQHGF